MAHRPVRVLAAIAIVPLLGIALGGCTAIGNVVIDQLGGGSLGDDGDRGAGDDDVSYVTHDNGNTDFYDLAVGMCIDEAGIFGPDFYASVDVVDCAQPHYAELYSVFDLEGSDYPGEDAVWDQSEDGCSAQFSQYVGTSWEESPYDYWYFYPTSDNWRAGDHEVMCLVIDYDYEQISGSARNGAI